MEPLQSQVREVLLKCWDPVNVGDNPLLRDEYDDYIDDIVELLGVRPSISQLSSCLRELRVSQIGVMEGAAKDVEAARRLLDLVASRQ